MINFKNLPAKIKMPGLTVIIGVTITGFKYYNGAFKGKTTTAIISMLFFYIVIALVISYFIVTRAEPSTKD